MERNPPIATPGPILVVLVGPKGSGKTTLGRLLEQDQGAHFLEVEATARQVLAEGGGVIDADYERRVFEAVEGTLLELATRHQRVVFETTGASDRTAPMLDALRKSYQVRLVRVTAGEAICRERIRGRDPTRQVDVPDAMVAEMHGRTEGLSWGWDLVVDNGAGADLAEAVRRIAELFGTRRTTRSG